MLNQRYRLLAALLVLALLVAIAVTSMLCKKTRPVGPFSGPGVQPTVAGIDPGLTFIGVRPDCGDELFDANGASVGTMLLGNDPYAWPRPYRRDFIFELPRAGDPITIVNAELRASHSISIIQSQSRLQFYADEHRALLSIRGDINKNDCRKYLDLIRSDMAHVDVTLTYYRGERGNAAIATFSGPFRDGVEVAAEGRTLVLQEAQWDVKIKIAPPAAQPEYVLVYDTEGKRYASAGGVHPLTQSGVPDFKDIWFSVGGVPLGKIATVTYGERPLRVTFHDIVVGCGRPERTHPAYLDAIATRLRVPISALHGDRFSNRKQALAAIDLARGGFIHSAAHYLTTPDDDQKMATALDPATIQRVRQAAALWLTSPDPAIRACGVRISEAFGWTDLAPPPADTAR